MYIRSTGNISPQKTIGQQGFPDELNVQQGNRVTCIEPDYMKVVDPKLIRRMSRIIKMGVAAAMECLERAETKSPDAIITGTAYGCLEDTEVFLSRLTENKEELLTPTAFIQSTHNTVAGQIALMLKCHNYNNTYVHRGFSFESALLDGIMMLDEGMSSVLVGGVDEITKSSHAILSRFGLYKSEHASNADLFKSKSKGTIAGEGASFFVLNKEASGNDLARLDALKTFYNVEESKIEAEIKSFLEEQGVSLNDIDLIITGRNGDARSDRIYERLETGLFAGKNVAYFKNLCGEYPTATAFALWLAANTLKQGTLPSYIEANFDTAGKSFKKLLIYNQYIEKHHSLYLLSAC